MSRAYRISVSESVRRVVHVSDGVCTELDLLPILGPERTRELLAEELARRGFRLEGDRAIRDEGEGVTLEVELDTRVVRVSIGGERELAATETRETWADTDDARAAENAKARLRADLESRLTRDAEEARTQLTEKLERKLGDLREELDRVVVRVTQEALKERAAQIGEVREISEDPETGAMTIRVKL